MGFFLLTKRGNHSSSSSSCFKEKATNPTTNFKLFSFQNQNTKAR